VARPIMAGFVAPSGVFLIPLASISSQRLETFGTRSSVELASRQDCAHGVNTVIKTELRDNDRVPVGVLAELFNATLA
jgi:hypothetical protein